MARLSNPFAFTSGPVSIITTIIYVLTLTAVIVTQTRVPTAPSSDIPIQGINLTEAWNDLQLLSAQYHPYNSRRNDYVHDWLLRRVKEIVKENKATSSTYIFEDNTSNLTFSTAGSTSSSAGVSVYFEGTNIIVYIRGSDDDPSDWWKSPRAKPSKNNAVLVNAHYDSVSSGFGSTDDGVGVVTVLQLIKLFTSSKKPPKNGVVLLLNNGEEDFLNGANVFSQHFMSRLVSTFLNLEGAGAGGRAALFRSTDEEVTQAYAKSPHPFGVVISGDAFERGLVRSQTDYIIFNGKLGLRGLDVAFIEPRARYHTDQDDSRHTGKKALWHMLSAAVATTSELTQLSLSNQDAGHSAVWFDFFGEAFAVMRGHTFFALAITDLVVGPVLLLLTLVTLYQADKLYMFSSARTYHTADGDEQLPLGGWKGFFRFPAIFVIASAAPIALAYLVFKENPFIAHSSEWAVWPMMISSFVFVAWFFSRSLDFARPSALTRAYAFSWLCGLWWALLVAATVSEEQFHLAGGYFVLFSSAALFIATWFAYLEMFSLPKKSKYCAAKLGDVYISSRSRSRSRPPAEETGESSEPNVAEESTETSALLRGRGRSAFKNYTRSEDDTSEALQHHDESPGNHEQEWSTSMWTWLWVIELIVLVPINVIILGQLALYLVAALHQTGPDGSSMFLVYISMAVLTILMFAPLTPLLHRFTWHVPLFLLAILVGTIIYNLLAFPFSPQNRLKLYFQQEVDLENGENLVSLIGVPGYVQSAISYIPSSAGEEISCIKADTFSDRQKCMWRGPVPKVAYPNSPVTIESTYKKWTNFNVTMTHNGTDSRTARFVVYGRNTRACKLVFDSVINDFHVKGQSPVDKRFSPVPSEGGSKEIRLWSRTWDRAWTVDVTWAVDDPQNHLSGKVVCLWSDANQRGIIPAFDEARHFAPEWVAITKAADGLVEGYKRFKI